MIPSADLHIHTYFSDGTFSPEQAVDEAVRRGLACISITDHDTVEGIPRAVEAARLHGLEVVPGIEISGEISNKDMHILAYFIDVHDARLQAHLRVFQDARKERVRAMIELLRAEGIDNIRFEEVCALTQSDSIGRMHLAIALVHKAWVRNVREAFDRYLNEGASAYVPKFRQTPQEAIALIRAAGGVAVLAHPVVTNRDEVIPQLVEAGLGGIEVYYPNCGLNLIRHYEKIALKYDLVITGGSDAHGDFKKNTHIGKATVPLDLVDKLRARAARG